MGKLMTGGGMFLLGVFLTVTVIGAIPGTILIFSGGFMMLMGFLSLTKSTVKGGLAAGKIIREMNQDKDASGSDYGPLNSPPQGNSTADEIRKLAELLSAGLLTQEEFDRKKAQLLA